MTESNKRRDELVDRIAEQWFKEAANSRAKPRTRESCGDCA
jgi:hypothetical protein